MSLVTLPAALRAQGGGVGNVAHVRRDTLGVAHITAESEEVAWFALGYEQARDGLLFLQYTCMAARGELAWVRGDVTGLLNDMAVKILDSHLGGLSVSQLRTLLAPASGGIAANFYDNCVAFAAGANEYRKLVQTATGTATPEGRLRDWLSNPANRFPTGQANLSWVYNQPIDPVDIASQGAMTAAMWLFFRPWLNLVNSNGIGYTDTDDDSGGQPAAATTDQVDPELVGDPLDPSSAPHLLRAMREYASGLCGMAAAMSGSNSFGWAHRFCRDPVSGVTFAGHVADPHQGLPFYSPNFMEAFRFAPNHMWFAHVQVTPPGATEPSYDVFGHVPYASATFQSCHNRTLAMGGTAAGANFRDHFVLRLAADPVTGRPLEPQQFYSHYHDVAPGTNSSYQPLAMHWIHIKRPDNVVVPLNYWRAQSFGFVLPNQADLEARILAPAPSADPFPLPVIHGERVHANQPPPRWRVDTRSVPPPPKMRYWATPQFDANNQPTTSPMVVSLRIPMDPAVAGNPTSSGENRHWQLARDFWEMSHATSVTDPILLPRTNGAAFPISVCFTDRDGRTMTMLLSAIPKRGDDAAIAAAGYSSLDKYVFYTNAAGPVPARHYEDRMFDWRFGSITTPARPAPLQYLEYPTNNQLYNIAIAGPFKALTFQDPTSASPYAFPPTYWSGSGANFKIDGGLFASASNDNVWGYSRRTDTTKWRNGSSTGPHQLNNLDVDNWLLSKVLDHGVAYQTDGLAFEALVNQQIVVDKFTQIAEPIVTQSSSGVPPLTPDEMKAFAVSPVLFSTKTYVPPDGVTGNPDFPVAIRQLKEIADNPGHAMSPLKRAEREIQFFKDLWAKLHDPASSWGSHPIQVQGQPTLNVDLRRLWIVGDNPNFPNRVFWYQDPQNPTVPGSLTWVEMPPGFQLIDFFWEESELGHLRTVGDAASGASIEVLTQQEQADFLGLLSGVLVPWSSTPPSGVYANLPASQGACLLEMMRMGYKAEDAYGRKWLRLSDGAVRYSGSTAPQQLVAGQLPGGSGSLVKVSQPWKPMEDLAFPLFQHTTLFRGGLEPPYAALYQPDIHPPQVRATLGPQQINELVEFFLKLGGHYINPVHNNGSPSRKMARWELAGQNPTTFAGRVPGTYPLTAGLERLTVVHRLLATAAFLGNPIPQLHERFTARAYGHDTVNSQWLWQAGGSNPQYVGHGLRSVNWIEDQTLGSGYQAGRGFQQRFLGMGGSYATLLTMFPSQGSVQSYFWCTPGVAAMGSDPNRFSTHMGAHAGNALLTSYYSNFQGFTASILVYVP